MLKINLITILTLSFMLGGCNNTNPIATNTNHNSTSTKKPIPWIEAKENQERYIINLPKGDDKNKEVELIVSKLMKTDTCNNAFFGGTVEKKTLRGWGYSYYVVTPSQMASTRMMCRDNKQVERYVQVRSGADMKVRYNSKLPIVVYVPKGFKVEYSIWKKDTKVYPAEKK